MAKVTIENGDLEGVERDGVVSYLGLPYAAPPVGALRWQPPQPAASWSGVRAATDFGPDPIQPPQTFRGGKTPSEDCLYLNVWTPAGHGGGNLPVMVFIYGGGFAVGTGALAAYNGSSLARRGAVLVTLNYRLGKFGFFAHPALTKENPAGPLGNYGLLDQIAALKWVKRNIAAFGGNPENVTIFGESAGGMSVHFLMRTEAATGLFHRAIAQSAPSRNPPQSFETAEAQGAKWAAEWGVSGEDAAALRAVPAEKVPGAPAPGRVGGPMLDGTIIPETTPAAFGAGRIAHVPYMIGTNSFETGFFAGMAAGIVDKLGENKAKALSLYDGYGTRDPALIDEEVMGDAMLTAPSRAMARDAAAAGLPTWLYYFDWLRPAQRGKVPGALHVDEIYAVFGTMDAPIGKDGSDEANDPAETKRIVDEMQSRWVAFARDGDPGKDWPRFAVGAEQLLAFGQDSTEVHSDFLKDRLDFINSLPPAR